MDQSLCASCGHGQPEGLSEWLRRTGWEGSWTKLCVVEGRGLKPLSLAFFSPSFSSRAGRRGSRALEKGGDCRAGRGGSHLLRAVGWGEGCREPLAPLPPRLLSPASAHLQPKLRLCGGPDLGLPGWLPLLFCPDTKAHFLPTQPQDCVACLPFVPRR